MMLYWNCPIRTRAKNQQTIFSGKEIRMLEKIQIVDKITLKELRSLTGKTQEEFAEFVEIPYTSYRRYELEMGNMSIDMLFRISEKTGVPVEKFKIN